MDSVQTLYFLLSNIVRELPELIVIIIGIFICFSRLKSFPKTGRMALGGLFVLLISAFLGIAMSFFFAYLPLWYRDSLQTIGYISFAVGIVFSIIRAVGLGLVIYAVWTERAAKTVNS